MNITLDLDNLKLFYLIILFYLSWRVPLFLLNGLAVRGLWFVYSESSGPCVMWPFVCVRSDLVSLKSRKGGESHAVRMSAEGMYEAGTDCRFGTQLWKPQLGFKQSFQVKITSSKNNCNKINLAPNTGEYWFSSSESLSLFFLRNSHYTYVCIYKSSSVIESRDCCELSCRWILTSSRVKKKKKLVQTVDSNWVMVALVISAIND